MSLSCPTAPPNFKPSVSCVDNPSAILVSKKLAKSCSATTPVIAPVDPFASTNVDIDTVLASVCLNGHSPSIDRGLAIDKTRRKVLSRPDKPGANSGTVAVGCSLIVKSLLANDCCDHPCCKKRNYILDKQLKVDYITGAVSQICTTSFDCSGDR